MEIPDKGSAFTAHIDAAALQKKLAIGSIGAWSLTFEGGQGTLELSSLMRTSLGFPEGKSVIAWDEFLATLTYPEDEPLLQQSMRVCCEDETATLSIPCRIWSKTSFTWNWMLFFGSADVREADSGRVVLSGGLQLLQGACAACSACTPQAESGLDGRAQTAAMPSVDPGEDGYKSLAFAYNKASSQLEMIAEGIGLSTWDWDVPTGVITYSDNFFRSLGYEPEEGKHTASFWGKIVHPGDRVMNLKMLNEHIAGTRPKLENELRLRHKNGHYLWMYKFWTDYRAQRRGRASACGWRAFEYR